MAKKQKKKRNKKYRQKYTTGGRLDMRNGGRVGYQTGGESIRTPLQQKRKKIEEDEMSIDRQNEIKSGSIIPFIEKDEPYVPPITPPITPPATEPGKPPANPGIAPANPPANSKVGLPPISSSPFGSVSSDSTASEKDSV